MTLTGKLQREIEYSSRASWPALLSTFSAARAGRLHQQSAHAIQRDVPAALTGKLVYHSYVKYGDGTSQLFLYDFGPYADATEQERGASPIR